MPVTGGNTSTVMSQIPPRACAGLGCQFAVLVPLGGDDNGVRAVEAVRELVALPESSPDSTIRQRCRPDVPSTVARDTLQPIAPASISDESNVRIRRPATSASPGSSAAGRSRRSASRATRCRWLHHAERPHRVGHTHETRDVGAEHIVAGGAVFLGRLGTAVVDVVHDLGQPLLGAFEGPAVARGVLLHLQRAGGHAAGVGGLARPEEHAGVLEGRILNPRRDGMPDGIAEQSDESRMSGWCGDHGCRIGTSRSSDADIRCSSS